jgi:hypothetical protein
LTVAADQLMMSPSLRATPFPSGWCGGVFHAPGRCRLPCHGNASLPVGPRGVSGPDAVYAVLAQGKPPPGPESGRGIIGEHPSPRYLCRNGGRSI